VPGQINDSPRQNPAYRLVAFLKYQCMKKIFVVIGFILSLFIACKNKVEKKDKDSMQVITSSSDSVSKINQDKDSALTQLSNEILKEIKNGSYSALAKYIDPVNGVQFSPWGFVQTTDDIVLSVQEFTEKAAKPKQGRMVWIKVGPTGDPVTITMDEYMRRWVYDVDFIKPEKFEVNKFIGIDKYSENNLLTVYKDCDFTESYISGFEKKYGGKKWRSLRLVYKMMNEKYYLVGVIHDEGIN
jgi:hypothetical protein